MNGDVVAVASNGPARGLPRPPLPHRPRGINRSLKQRERETPNVDWERSLQHFAAAVDDDLNELHTRFLEENIVTFAAWKRLWRDARMSAAFHVEFWESTPTNTHKTILQQALDGLVWCIEEHDGEFEDAADVAALIGRVFAMYCAYSVQLGTPKHKIDVDPQAWTALLTINCVVSGVGATRFPTAAREVRAMMHRLVVQESTFLRCLQGFGPSVRVKNRSVRSVAAASQDLSLVADTATAEDAPVKRSKVEQLRSLNDRYQELMSRARAGPSVSGAGARLGSRRGKLVVSSPLLSGSLSQEAGNDGQDLARALTLYMEYKANEEARGNDRIARAAAAREHESRIVLELSDDSNNIPALSDRGSAMSVPPSPMARSVTSGGSEAFLAELESELHADISSDQVEPTKTLAPRKLARKHSDKPFSACSEISEADSDALADLERELEQSVGVVSQTQKEAYSEKASPPARRKRGRNPSAAGIVSRKAPRTAASTLKPVDTFRVEDTRPTAKRARSDSVSSRLSFAASSTADSDGLAAIQAELDAIPTLPGPRKVESISRRIDNQQSSIEVGASTVQLPAANPRTKPTAKPKAKQSTQLTAGRASGRRRTPVVVVEHGQRAQSTDQRTKGKSRALSVVFDSSELIAQLQAELDFSAEPLSKASTSVRTCTTANRTRPRRSSRLSSVASETDSNALEELERELNATTATLRAVPPPPVSAPTKTAPRKRGAVPSKRAAQRTTRSNAKKIRLNDVDTSVVTAVHHPPAAQTFSKTHGKQQVSISGPIVQQKSSRISSVSSDTESDGLAELVAELDTTVTIQTSTPTQLKRILAAKRAANTHSTIGKKPPTSPKTSRSAPVRSKVPPPVVTLAAVGLRRSARLSSLASDTESDGLEDLMAELESAPASGPAPKPPVAKTKKPRARVTTTRKQPARAQGAKSKQNQVKEGPKATRTPRAAQQTQAKQKRAASQKLAANPPTRQLPAAPVNLPSSRRSTRSSSVAFDSDSDGLAELEAELQVELQAGPT